MAEKLKSEKRAGIHSEVLKSLISKCDEMRADMDEARGTLGAAIKDAEDTHGVHRKAFKLVLSLKRMEDAARADFLRALDDYREKLDLNPQKDLFDEADEGDEQARRAQQADAAATADRAAENSAALKGGIKQKQPAGVH
ncbi:hypothetical protein [Methylobacterium segetis]|uniref:hypothetical protein n=1 Tax=Methylobacterium segetis TaxID=2488750 RepID=UPI001053C240|nr:hypothetical protein [Methylobacterium segetis]